MAPRSEEEVLRDGANFENLQDSFSVQDGLPTHVGLEDFSRVHDFVEDLKQKRLSPLFPIPLLSLPVKLTPPHSSRLRSRLAQRRRVCKMVNRAVTFLNSLHSGNLKGSRQEEFTRAVEMNSLNEPQLAVVRRLVVLVQSFLHGRRDFGLTGDQEEVLMLLKQVPNASGYTRVSKSHAQVSLVADRIVEPSVDQVVPMLDALPPLEAQFYAEESNCINTIGKSITIQNEIEAQYAFVGGPHSEYLAYFRRQDLPKSMWRWAAYQDVKAVSGFSVVPKKDGKSQRKLLMACSFNYWLDDIEKRSRLGMDAGGAINRLHVEGRGFDIATCDQSNAFTWVEVPQWFWYYQACPPVVALEVWDLLPQDVQCRVGRSGLVSPLYTRLPMGCSHSVHILMQINLRILGQTLHHHSLLHKPNVVAVEEQEDDSKPDHEVVVDELFFGCSDEQWWKRQELRRVGSECTGKSVQVWLQHIQDLKSKDVRTFVVLLLFSGERRRHDIQEELEKKAIFHGLRVDVMSVDLAMDPRWDLACPETFNSLMEAGEHFIDAQVVDRLVQQCHELASIENT